MLIMASNRPADKSRNPKNAHGLWHDGDRFALSLGCTRCPERKLCGGLHVNGAIFDCLYLCCNNHKTCDSVCRNKPDDFSRRVREIAGFSLENVPRSSVLKVPKLPKIVPLIFHGNNRIVAFKDSSAVCLPLYKVIQRHDGHPRYVAWQDLTKSFAISQDTIVVLTGTATDPAIERWWSLGSQRLDAIRELCDLGISLVTTPNFSLFTDQPRWDDLHSIKRIAIVHEEFLRAGLPAALHINARTDRDWERWQEYIIKRPEVTHIAFEFSTGAGRAGRIDWHIEQLARLAKNAGRPLHLVFRGGTKALPKLTRIFSDITLLETSAFVKTMQRQRATLLPKGTLNWQPSPTNESEKLDCLFCENWQVVRNYYYDLLQLNLPALKATG